MRGLVFVIVAAICVIAAAGVFISGHRDVFSLAPAPAEEPAEAVADAPAPPPPAPARAVKTPPEPVAAAPAPAPAAPSQQPAAQPERPSPTPAAAPAVRIAMPPALSGLQYGMAADAISARFPISWTREHGGSVTLVHYPEGPGGMQVRFECGAEGLYGIELYMKPPEGKTLAQFHQDVRKQYAAAYGSLPGTAATGWNDGQTVLAVTLAPAHVVVSFRAAH